jgi:acyl-CoA thioesterase I
MACSGEAEPPQQLVYLAIGASDAAGVGAEPVTDGYVYVIAGELAKRIDEVFPTLLAIPGADAEELDGGLDRLRESEIEPDLVTIWTGANDVIRVEDVDDFEAALEHMLERLRERTDGIIVAANIPDLTKLPRFREQPDENVTRERIEAFNDTIAEQATAHDVLVVDLYAQPVEGDLVSEDGFHPSNAGHRRIAEEFLEVILPALGLAPEA